MANWNNDLPSVPWLPVHSDEPHGEPLAPSKPAVPGPRGAHQVHPQPIEDDDGDADITPAVTPPPPEEVLPSNGSAAWDSVPVFSLPPTSAASSVDQDPVRSLGDAAVRRASLSTAGAATSHAVAPSSPSAPPAAASAPPAAASALPAHGVPATDSAAASTPLRATTAPGFMDTTPPDDAPQPTHAVPPELADESPPYTPAFGVPAAPQPAGGDGSDGDEPPAKDKGAPWWRSWPFLTVLGLIVMGAIAYFLVVALSDSEPVEVTAPVIVASPEEPTLDPISIDDPTPFQEVLPGAVGTYALTAIETPEVSTLDLVVRAAEVDLLTYEGADGTMSVRAIQHFDEETATTHFDEVAAGGTDRAAVDAGGTDVGERVTIAAADGTTIVWRNATAIFFVTGPDDAVEDFFTDFPL